MIYGHEKCSKMSMQKMDFIAIILLDEYLLLIFRLDYR